MKKLTPILCLCAMLLCSCTDSDNTGDIWSVAIGMKPHEVDSIMGKPINIIVGPQSKEFPKHDSCCFIHEYKSAFGASDNYKVWFLKADSTVYFVGRGE